MGYDATLLKVRENNSPNDAEIERRSIVKITKGKIMDTRNILAQEIRSMVLSIGPKDLYSSSVWPEKFSSAGNDIVSLLKVAHEFLSYVEGCVRHKDSATEYAVRICDARDYLKTVPNLSIQFNQAEKMEELTAAVTLLNKNLCQSLSHLNDQATDMKKALSNISDNLDHQKKDDQHEQERKPAGAMLFR